MMVLKPPGLARPPIPYVSQPVGPVPAIPFPGPPGPLIVSAETSPIDLWGTFDPPQLPRGLLPRLIEDYATSVGAQMGADPAGLAMSALAVCAAAIPDAVRVQVKQHDGGWTESARIWVALIGLPSTKKSPIMAAAVRPLAKIDGALIRDWRRRYAEWIGLSKEERAGTPEPGQHRVRLGDTTIEAAQEVFKCSVSGLLVHSDELTGWFGALEKYSGGRGASADRAFWLQAFNGGEYAVNRIGRGAFLIDNLSACLLGGIQPDAIRAVAADSVDDGLLQRFFPVVLRTATLGMDGPTPFAQILYEAAVSSCARAVCDRALKFDAGAHLIRRDVEERHLRLATSDAVTRKLASHIGKLDGLFARLCVLWHTIDHCLEPSLLPVIEEATAKRVAGFMRSFLLPHAASFYSGVLGLGDEHDRLQAIAGYILAHGLTHVDNRTVQRGDRTMRRIANKDVQPLLEQLSALNWLARGVGGPGDGSWVVNPFVHQLFAERARRERDRRTEARSALAEIFSGR